jgi:hypothetical protein
VDQQLDSWKVVEQLDSLKSVKKLDSLWFKRPLSSLLLVFLVFRCSFSLNL